MEHFKYEKQQKITVTPDRNPLCSGLKFTLHVMLTHPGSGFLKSSRLHSHVCTTRKHKEQVSPDYRKYWKQEETARLYY